jgi:hypothetical protein
MQDRPTAPEALEALTEFLAGQVQPAVPVELSFHVRVAVNLLRIVERELRLGPELERAEHERLVMLLGHEGELGELNRELAAGLRDGSIDHRSEGLFAHLRQTAEDKLRVANPRYLEAEVAT